MAKAKNSALHLSTENSWMPVLICLSSGLYVMFEFFQLSMLNQINPILREVFSANSVEISRLANSYPLINILFLLPAGIILDRYSTRRVILITFSICILSTIGFALATSWALIVIFHGLTGIGDAFCLAAGVILISRWLPDFQRATYIGFLVTMNYVGGILAQGPMHFLIVSFGWRQAVLIDAAVGALILTGMFLIIRDHPVNDIRIKPKKSILKHDSIWKETKRATKLTQTWLVGLYIAFMDSPVIILGSLWGASYLQVAHSLTRATSSIIISAFFIGIIIGCPLCGFLSDKIKRRKPIMYIGAIGLCLLYLPFIFGFLLSDKFLLCQFFLMGICSSAQVLGYPLISENNYTKDIGKATSIATLLVILVGAIGGGVYSQILEISAPGTSTNYAVEHYQYAMWILPIASVLALFLLYFIKEAHSQIKKGQNDHD